MNSSKRSNQQNVDNLEVLTEKVITFIPAYDPSEARLSIQNQREIKASGDAVLEKVAIAETVCDNAITARNIAFDALDPFVTRLINGLRISDVPAQTVEQGESLVREFRNQRATPIEPPSKTDEGSDEEESSRNNKLRNSSFNTKIENYRNIVLLLSSLLAYKPNEKDLRIDALKVRLTDLKHVNSVAVAAEAAAEAARQLRDIILYADKTGLFDVAMDSKLYVKSAYGATSTQYKSISGILFTRPR